MNSLWALFIALQIYSAGNVNYQQANGYYEINPIYGKHPTHERVYFTKAMETAAVYGLTKLYPKHEKKILTGVSSIALGFVWYDTNQGIEIAIRF